MNEPDNRATSLSHSISPATPLLEAQPTPSLILSPESLLVLDVNEAFLQALGICEKETRGRSILQWIHVEQRQDFARTLRMAGRHSLPNDIAFQWVSPNGTQTTMRITAWTLRLSSHTQVIELSASPVSTQRGTFDTQQSVG